MILIWVCETRKRAFGHLGKLSSRISLDGTLRADCADDLKRHFNQISECPFSRVARQYYNASLMCSSPPFFNPFPNDKFRLFHTERVCKRRFQIGLKWQKVLQTGRKHCGKKRNCSLRAISPFPTVFSKDLYCRPVKTMACLGKG